MKMTIKKLWGCHDRRVRDLCVEAEVKFLACQMTVELFGFNS